MAGQTAAAAAEAMARRAQGGARTEAPRMMGRGTVEEDLGVAEERDAARTETGVGAGRCAAATSAATGADGACPAQNGQCPSPNTKS